MIIVQYTADHEEPDCGNCEHVCDNFPCEESCGPEHGWHGYNRTETMKDEDWDGYGEIAEM
jgi:hypothetical protein